MAELWGRAGGVNRKLRELYARDGGANRKLREMWAREGGVGRKIFSAGAHLFAEPYVGLLHGNNGDGNYLWAIDENKSTFSFTPGNGITFDTWLWSSPTNNSGEILPELRVGAVIPLDLGETVDFVAHLPCLRCNVNLDGTSGNRITDYDADNHHVVTPEKLFISLRTEFENNGFYPEEYFGDENISWNNAAYGEAEDGANYTYVYQMTNAPVTFSCPYERAPMQQVYLFIAFEIPEDTTYSRGAIAQVACSIPNFAFTIIGADGTEYPVDFSF